MVLMTISPKWMTKQVAMYQQQFVILKITYQTQSRRVCFYDQLFHLLLLKLHEVVNLNLAVATTKYRVRY